MELECICCLILHFGSNAVFGDVRMFSRSHKDRFQLLSELNVLSFGTSCQILKCMHNQIIRRESEGLTLTKVYGIAGLSQSKVQGAIGDLVTCL